MFTSTHWRRRAAALITAPAGRIEAVSGGLRGGTNHRRPAWTFGVRGTLRALAAGLAYCGLAVLGFALLAEGAVHAAALEPPPLVGALPDVLDWRGAPVDLSFLNAPERPAGKHGFLHSHGDALQFDDGTPARFWGTNLTAAALFGTDRAAVRTQARRLSQLGFNLVRLHHIDSYWVHPNLFGGPAPHDTRHLDPAMLDRIDWWVHCLKEEGIYVWLDLHVQRHLRAADGIAAFDEISHGRPDVGLKGYNYVDPDIVRAMQDFDDAYLGHVNPYTGHAYRDEPAVAAVLLTNENDVTHHFAQRLLPDKHVPTESARYLAAARAFAGAHGLDDDVVWRSWKDGPSRLFLNDLEHRFNVAMIAHLRHMGVKVPIVTTSLWGGRLMSLPALTDGDLIDVHDYAHSGLLSRDPRRDATAIQRIAAAQLPGRPLSVSEWNMGGFPAPDRQVLPLLIAAAGCHQGWDALMQYAYAQTPLQRPGAPSNWQSFNDPALLAGLPAAALLFRQQHVREATTTEVLAPTAAQVFDQGLSAGGSPAMRAAAERGRLITVLPAVTALPWLHPGAAAPDAPRVAPAPGPTNGAPPPAVSDTGELRRDIAGGVYTIDTPRTQAALGRLGGRPVTLADVRIELDVAGDSSVSVQSLDGRAIARSQNLLVSLATPSQPRTPGRLPFVSVPARGVIRFHAARGLRLRTDTGRAATRHAVHLAYAHGGYTLRLDGNAPVHWVHLQVPTRSRP